MYIDGGHEALVVTLAEELYPVVRGPAMAGGKADAKLGSKLRGQECHRRGWRNSDPVNVHARACQPGDDCRFEELARRARIAPYDRNGPRGAAVLMGQDVGRSDRQVYRQCGA